jgi:hypothetical protein
MRRSIQPIQVEPGLRNGFVSCGPTAGSPWLQQPVRRPGSTG